MNGVWNEKCVGRLCVVEKERIPYIWEANEDDFFPLKLNFIF